MPRSKKAKSKSDWENSYAFREYGVTEAEMKRFEANIERDYQKNKKAGKLIVLKTRADWEKLYKKLFGRNVKLPKFN